MFDICLIYEYLIFKSSYFNPAKKIKNALTTNSAMYYLLTVVCELLMFYKILSLIKLDPFKIQVSNIYNWNRLIVLVFNDTTFKVVPYTKPC